MKVYVIKTDCGKFWNPARDYSRWVDDVQYAKSYLCLLNAKRAQAQLGPRVAVLEAEILTDFTVVIPAQKGIVEDERLGDRR